MRPSLVPAEQTDLGEVWLQTNGTLLTPDCVAQINTLPREKIRCHCIMHNIWRIPHQIDERPMSAWSDLLTDPCLESLKAGPI